MVGGLGRGAATGAAYGFALVVLLVLVDQVDGDRDSVGDALASVALLGLYAGWIGALTGTLLGVVGAVFLWWLAELGLPRRWLLLAAAGTGAALGWFAVALMAGDPWATPEDVSGLLALRGGPALFGAAGATWQGARTEAALQTARGRGPAPAPR